MHYCFQIPSSIYYTYFTYFTYFTFVDNSHHIFHLEPEYDDHQHTNTTYMLFLTGWVFFVSTQY